MSVLSEPALSSATTPPYSAPNCWMFCTSLRYQACGASKTSRDISGADMTIVSLLKSRFSANPMRTASRCDMWSSQPGCATCGNRLRTPQIGRAETRNPNGTALAINTTISARRSPMVLVFAPLIVMDLAMLKDVQSAGTGAVGNE
jgi:hypothetical protein